MEPNVAVAKSPEGGAKKNMEELSKEELINKCKGLLSIAQKAKQSKNDLQKDVESLRQKLELCETEKNTSHANVQTLQELVDSLTVQKLTYITQLDSAQSKIKLLDGKCHNYEEDIKKCKADLLLKDQMISEVTQRISNFDTELVSLRRQSSRLIEENEQLIDQLAELESRTAEFNTIGLQQQVQLQALEERVSLDDNYKIKIEELNTTIKNFEAKLDVSSNTLNNETETQVYTHKIKEITELYELEKSKKDKVNIKLRSYKDKILKCAACINQLKNSRLILSKTVKEYSENIPKWQADILNASKVLEKQINALNEENSSLKEKLSTLEQKTNDIPKYDGEALKTKVDQLNEENKSMFSNISILQSQVEEMQQNKASLLKELSEVKQEYENLRDIQLPQLHENKITENHLKEVAQKLVSLQNENKDKSRTIQDMELQITILNKEIANKSQSYETVENLILQIKSLESEKDMLVKEKFGARDTIVELEKENKILTYQEDAMHAEIQTLKSEVENLHKENSNIKKEKGDEVNTLKSKLNDMQEQYTCLKKELDNVVDLNGLLKEEVETMKLSLEQPKDDSENQSDLNDSLQADLVRLETKLSAYKQENASLLIEVKDNRVRLKEYDAVLAEFEETKAKLAAYKSENTELLSEMKEINQVLKERGEVISKLQKAVSEMEMLVENLENDRDSDSQEKADLKNKIESLQKDLMNAKNDTAKCSEARDKIVGERDELLKSLAEKEVSITNLKEEIDKLKQQQGSSELPNDDMSTSTISKAEEHARMKDLDETFEDKYSKLRMFALKLKKKLNETTAQLESSEQDKAKLEKLLSENGAGDKNAPIPVANEEVDGIKVGINTVNVDTLNELGAKLKDLSVASVAKDQLIAELENVKAELVTKRAELSAEIEAHKVTKGNLEKAKRDVKNKNVLSLEMEDYERSMKELTMKMEDNKKKLVQMESTIDTQEGTITAMKTQIKLLEEQIKAEEITNRMVKGELQRVVEEGKEKDNMILMKNGVINKLEQDLEDEKRKNEESDLEMTSVLSEKEKAIISLGDEKADLNNKIKRLEFRCCELEEKLKITNIELADLKTEYTSYKVRAQAVLRQNQTVDHSQEEQLKEEAAALKSQIESLTAKLTTAQEQCSNIRQEAEASKRRVVEAAGEVTRAQQRTARLQADLARLGQQIDSERSQHKLQINTLTQCYKTQIAELELKLQKDTEALRKQLPAQETTKTVTVGSPADNVNHNYMLPVIPKEDSDGEMDINVSMIPREEGEGSESAPSPPLSKSFMSGGGSGRSPVPLERLLEEGVPEDESLDASSLALTSEQEIAELRRKLQAQQQRVNHVTVLLSESERECARMAQLAELLKGELRRVRGSTSDQNTEYMKNVTLKFLTLPPGDERSRLVPVLQKILTLTPDESHKINAIAKGHDPNASKGWGSYLPWPGGK